MDSLQGQVFCCCAVSVDNLSKFLQVLTSVATVLFVSTSLLLVLFGFTLLLVSPVRLWWGWGKVFGRGVVTVSGRVVEV